MTAPADLPPWLLAHVQKCRDAFGIGGDWPVQVDLCDSLSVPDHAGETHVNHRYMHAAVTLRRDLDPAGNGPLVVTHELLHAAAWQQDGVIARILELVPRKLRPHATALWHDGNERYIEQMARALTPLLQAMEHPPEAPDAE